MGKKNLIFLKTHKNYKMACRCAFSEIDFIEKSNFFLKNKIIGSTNIYWKIAKTEIGLYFIPQYLLSSALEKFFLTLKIKALSVYSQLKFFLKILKFYKKENKKNKKYLIIFFGFTNYLTRSVYFPLLNKGNLKIKNWALKSNLKEKNFYFKKPLLTYILCLYKAKKIALAASKKSFLPFCFYKNVFEYYIFRYTIFSYEILNFLKESTPKTVINYDVNNPLSRLTTFWAIKRKIGTIQIQAGPIDNNAVEFKYCEDKIFLCQDNESQNAFRKLNQKTMVFVTGSPKYQQYMKKSQTKKRHRILILLSYTLPAYGKDSARVLTYNESRLFIWLKHYENMADFVIKPHPLKKFFRIPNLKCDILDKSIDPIGEIIKSNIIITFGSALTFDAYLLGKKTAIFALGNWKEFIEWSKSYPMIPIISSENKLVKFLETPDNAKRPKIKMNWEKFKKIIYGKTK